jgi:hypothetical protein
LGKTVVNSISQSLSEPLAAVEDILHEKFGITENDLAETYTPDAKQ